MSANWEHIQNLFLEAVELSSEERARFLDTACGDDAETRREVESLLAHDAAGKDTSTMLSRTPYNLCSNP